MNVLSPRETKTCSAGQSKFKVLTIKLQILPAHLVTFWRHLRKHLNGGKVSLFYYPTRAGILSFVVLKITMNDRKSIGEFLWDIDCDLLQYAGDLRKKAFTSTLSARYLTEEDLDFLPEGHKRLVMNMIARLRTPERVVVQRFWSCTPGLSELFDNFRYCHDWFMALFVPVVIGRSDCFGFGMKSALKIAGNYSYVITAIWVYAGGC